MASLSVALVACGQGKPIATPTTYKKLYSTGVLGIPGDALIRYNSSSGRVEFSTNNGTSWASLANSTTGGLGGTEGGGGGSTPLYLQGDGILLTEEIAVDFNRVASLTKAYQIADSLGSLFVRLDDSLWQNTYQRALNVINGSPSNLAYQNGLQRIGNTVNALYGSPIWNAGMIQTKYVTAAAPKNGQTLLFDSLDNILKWGFPDSVKLDNYFTNYYNKTQTDSAIAANTTSLANYYTKSQSDARYLQSFSETDPVYSANGVAKTTTITINGTTYDLSTNRSWTISTGSGTLSGLTDVALSSVANNQLLKYNSTTTKWENWTPNFLTSYTETDPVYSASTAAGITGTNISNWNTAYGWGNHALAGYLTSYTETDPVIKALNGVVIGNNGSAATAITGTANQVLRRNAANTAYEFYTLPSYLTSYTETDPNALLKANNLSDLTNTATARTNLGLGTAATQNSSAFTAANTAITGATKTKITYDSKGLVTAGADATTSDISEGSNLYYTNARARAAVSLSFSTSGSSGAASGTYDNSTGIFTINVPNYAGGGGGSLSGSGAANQMAYWSSTSALTGNAALTFTPSQTASNLIAKGLVIAPSLTQTNRNDTLVGVYVKPNFDVTAGANARLRVLSAYFDGAVYIKGSLDTFGVAPSLRLVPYDTTTAAAFSLRQTSVLNGQDWLFRSNVNGTFSITNFTNPSAAADVMVFNKAGTVATFAGVVKATNGSAGIGNAAGFGDIVWLGTASPSTSNYFAYGEGSNYYVNTPGDLLFRKSNATHSRIYSTGNWNLGGSSDIASAKLAIVSTTQGFLPPKMTATQASAIASPAEALLVYVSDTNGTFTAKGWWGYDGSAWQKLNN